METPSTIPAPANKNEAKNDSKEEIVDKSTKLEATSDVPQSVPIPNESASAETATKGKKPRQITPRSWNFKDFSELKNFEKNTDLKTALFHFAANVSSDKLDSQMRKDFLAQIEKDHQTELKRKPFRALLPLMLGKNDRITVIIDPKASATNHNNTLVIVIHALYAQSPSVTGNFNINALNKLMDANLARKGGAERKPKTDKSETYVRNLPPISEDQLIILLRELKMAKGVATPKDES
jgi:hypothetical protein